MDLLLSLESNNSIVWCGKSDIIIGTLKPGASIDIPLCLITLHTGIVVSNLFIRMLKYSLIISLYRLSLD